MKGRKIHLFDRPRNVRRLLYTLYGACLLMLVLERVLHRHSEHPLESVFAFYPLYGFIGCVTLVLVARGMRRFIKRPADYYRRRDLPRHPEDLRRESADG